MPCTPLVRLKLQALAQEGTRKQRALVGGPEVGRVDSRWQLRGVARDLRMRTRVGRDNLSMPRLDAARCRCCTARSLARSHD